jgi:hypothetical protein
MPLLKYLYKVMFMKEKQAKKTGGEKRAGVLEHQI